MVKRSLDWALQVMLGRSFIWPVIMVSPTPGENLGHLMEAVWLGAEESLEGTTETQSEGVMGTGAGRLDLSSPWSTLLVLVLVTAGAAGWEGREG